MITGGTSTAMVAAPLALRGHIHLQAGVYLVSPHHNLA